MAELNDTGASLPGDAWAVVNGMAFGYSVATKSSSVLNFKVQQLEADIRSFMTEARALSEKATLEWCPKGERLRDGLEWRLVAI